MTKAEVLENFKKYVLPHIKKKYEKDGIVDKPARSQEWCNYVDSLQKSGVITQEQADTWSNPY